MNNSLRHREGFYERRRFEERVLLRKDDAYPRISVVTPSYNQAAFLERTILSVLNQNYPNLEYIVIDGGSTDGSVDIIRRYEKYLSYWESEPDKGQADALNKGFKLATGELVGWQNSDDLYLPGAFMTVAEAFRNNSDADIFFGNIVLIDAADDMLREMRFHPFSVNHLIYYDWNLSSQAVFWKSALFDDAGYLEDYSVSFDWEWFIRLGKKNYRFFFIHDFIGAYRLHAAAKSSVMTNRDDIKRQILGAYGIDYKSGAIFKKRHRVKRLYFKCTKLVHHLLQKDFTYIEYAFKNSFRNKQRPVHYATLQ